MNYTEKRLERTIEQIGIASYGGISFIPSSRYKSDLIKILTKLTHQALAEERESVREEIKEGVGYGRFGFSRTDKGHEGEVAINIDDLLSSLDKIKEI